MGRDTSKYGRYYWCIKVPESVGKNGEIYVHADACEVLPHGDLLLKRVKPEGEDNYEVNLALASGQWIAVYAASLIDGGAVAIEHWAGEVAEPIDR